MTGLNAFIVSTSDDLRQRGEDACRQLGWTPLQIPIGAELDTHSAFEQLRHVLTQTLPEVQSVCVLGANNTNETGLEDMVRALASQHDCHFLSMDSITANGLSTSPESTICIVINESLNDIETTLEVVKVLSCFDSQGKSQKVPFQYLYSLYFDHIKHEAAWVNSRFVWFMFANSALLVTFCASEFSEFGSNDVAGIVAIVGLLLSLITFGLQLVTYSAEARAIKQCVKISDAWKKRVPHIADYLYDTPAGGDSPIAHHSAQLLMLATIFLFFVLWMVLGIKTYNEPKNSSDVINSILSILFL